MMDKLKFDITSLMLDDLVPTHEIELKKLTLFERRIVKAIVNDNIFCVFQPIVDKNLHMQGAEALVRWRVNNEIIPPSQFLSRIQSPDVWLLLTTFVLNKVVDTINYFKGTQYISINIPADVVYSGYLSELMAKGCSKLADPQWGSQLVLEISESTNFNSVKSQKVLSDLAYAGFQVFLDDCFSQGSVMFPVRHVKFNGFKLDMSVVDNFQNDNYDLNLIKSLLYFCELNGAVCVAEGVDSESKLCALIEIGVSRFQGYMISPPVDFESLKRMNSAF